MLEGVLQQLVNCFLKASGGSLTFRHELIISSKISCPQASNDQRLPCPAVPSWFSWGKQGSGPNRGQIPVEWGDFLSVCPSVHPSVYASIRLSVHPSVRLSVHLSIHPSIHPFPPLDHPARHEAQLARSEAWLSRPQAWLAGPHAWLAGPQSWLAGPQTWLDGPEEKETNRRMNGWTENLPTLQEFIILYRGRCPKSVW